MSDVVSESYKSAGNPLDPNNKEMAKGFWSAGQPNDNSLKKMVKQK